MPLPIPFMKGKSALCKVFIANSKIDVAVKTWKIQPDVTKINDGVNGEDRDRIDREVNFYTVTLAIWMPDAKVFSVLLDDQAVDDAGVQPQEKAFGLVLKPQDGSKFGVACKEGVLDDWDVSSSGRTDRLMLGFPFRFRYIDKVSL